MSNIGRKELREVSVNPAACKRLAGFFGGAARHAIYWTVREADSPKAVEAGTYAAVSNARAAWRAALWATRDAGTAWRGSQPMTVAHAHAWADASARALQIDEPRRQRVRDVTIRESDRFEIGTVSR